MIKEILAEANKISSNFERDNILKEIVYQKVTFKKQNQDELIKYFAKIYYTVENQNELARIMYSDKLIELQDELIMQIEHLFTERINLNPVLTSLIDETIVPYYKGRFTMNLSREIGFLPLELRLKIYCQLLKQELGSYTQMHLVDRLAITLYKAGELFLGEIALFISSWMKSNLSLILNRQFIPFSEMLLNENQSLEIVKETREKILNTTDLTPEIAGREFWYGFSCFSDREKINDINAAKICLELFYEYYKNSFKVVSELYKCIMAFYKTGNRKALDDLLRMQGIDEINIVNLVTVSGNAPDANITATINELQKLQIGKTLKNGKYNLLNQKGLKLKESLEIPSKISQAECLRYIRYTTNLYLHYKITFKELDVNFKSVYVAIANSDDWELEVQNLIFGLYGELYGIMYGRNSNTKSDIEKILMVIEGLLNKYKQIHTVGEGWTNQIISEDSNTNTEKVLIQSNDSGFPSYLGIMFSPRNLSDIEDEELLEVGSLLLVNRSFPQRLYQALQFNRSEIKAVNGLRTKLKNAQLRKIGSEIKSS